MEKIKIVLISWLQWMRKWLQTVEQEPDLRARREEFVEMLRRLAGGNEKSK